MATTNKRGPRGFRGATGYPGPVGPAGRDASAEAVQRAVAAEAGRFERRVHSVILNAYEDARFDLEQRGASVPLAVYGALTSAWLLSLCAIGIVGWHYL